MKTNWRAKSVKPSFVGRMECLLKRQRLCFPPFRTRTSCRRRMCLSWRTMRMPRGYLSIDPAGAKPWTMVLFGIDPHGVAWAVKEFPDFDTYGGWIDMTKGDKVSPGEAAQPNGFGLRDYAEVIRRMEGDRMVDRIIDPRLGAASYQKSEGSSNIIDDLADEGFR